MYLMRRIFFLCQPASLVRVGHEEGKGDVGGKGNTEYKSLSFRETTSSQAPSYASPKLRLTESLTGVKCRATSVAKNLSLQGYAKTLQGMSKSNFEAKRCL